MLGMLANVQASPLNLTAHVQRFFHTQNAEADDSDII